jgi:hypothetical protein
MANLPSTSHIASRAKKCVDLFNSLGDIFRQPDHQSLYGASESEIIDGLGRFKIWAGNLGALQSFASKSSLDYRLREAPRIEAQIIDILNDLADSLGDGAYLILPISNGP